MPNKRFSEWTENEKTQLADELKQKSNEDCATYMQEAQQQMGQLASYEAAACLYKTYYLGTPADYPGREQLKSNFYDSAQKARALGSNAPVISDLP
jgi:hypothetical protein